MQYLEPVLKYVVAPLIPILVSLIVAGLAKLISFLHEKQGQSRVVNALGVGAELVNATISHVVSGMKADLQAALADGKLDAAEKAQLKARALELIKADLPASIQGVLSTTLGPALDTWLSGKVSDAIDAKASP